MENTFEHADLFQEQLDGAANFLDLDIDLGAPLLEEEPTKEREAVAVKEPEYEVPDPPKPTELSGKMVEVRGKEYPVEYFNEVDGKLFWKPEHKPGSGFIYGSGEDDASLMEDLSFYGNELARNLSFAGAGIMDFGVDLATTIGNRLGLNVESVNKQWDQLTKDPSPERQKLRKFASVVIPTMMGTRQATMGIQATALPGAVKGVATVGSAAAIDAAVIGISDEGLEDNGARMLADTFPAVFGTNGAYPIPDSWKTLDSDSPAIRKQKNMQESIGMSVIGDFLGFTMGAGKKVLDWFIPKDDAAAAYKKSITSKADAETVSRIAEIEQALATKPSQANTKVLQEEKARLLKQLEETGQSEVTTKSKLERTVEQAEESRRSQMDEVAILKLEAEPQGFGYIPEVTPGLAQPNQLARQSIPPANIARNMADTTAIKNGDVVGDPAPMLSEPMLKKGLVLGKSRNAVAGIAESAREVSNFDAVVDGFRYTSKNMRDAAWNIYNDIIRAGSVDDVKRLFASDRDVKTLIDGTKVTYLNEVQQAQATQAINDLVDLYLGREVTESSARIMDTLGREIASISEASVTYRDLADDDRIQEMIADKLEYLMAEVGLNKYISGWQLQNKNIFQRIAKSKDPGELTNLINDEFQRALNSRHASVKRFRKNLDQIKKSNPEMARTFYDAFSRTNGDVDTIEKLYKWADSQISVMGMIKSPTKGQMNLFARGLWGVGMNNVLSGLSALNAAKGTVSNLILKPITSILGHGIEAAIQRDIEPLKKAFYYHGAVFETQKRALQDGLQRIKTTHQDYDFMMSQIRKDYVIEDVKEWDMLETIAAARQNDRGFQFQYNWAKTNRDVSRMKWMRTGMTGMSGVDAYGDTVIATHMSRLRAYDDVFTKHGKVTPELLAEAERANYSRMFNADGVLTDEAAKNASGEIALNLDDAVSSYINSAVTAVPAFKPFFMFPKTSANDIKNSLSYTPIALIPGMNKYSKVLLAGNDINKIKAALAEHGIKNFDATPNAMAIYKNLQAEYRGRLALSSIASISAYNYAMGGNIRGNGPLNASERKKLRDNYGWEPKTIKIGDKWVSYKGIPLLDTMLSIVGDLAYYSNDIGSSISEDIVQKVSWTVAATWLNNTPLAGMEPLLAAMNGDESAWARTGAQLARTFIPASGALGVVSNAITSTQKDIYKDMIGYVSNRLPGASSLLPERIDVWTGGEINDIDNIGLRILNALSPIKVSGTAEPWRQWLLGTGFDGVGLLRFSSDGGREYTAEERELIGRYMGEMQLWKEVDRMSGIQRYNDEIEEMRQYRRSGATYEEVKIKEEKLPVYRRLNQLVETAKKYAEQRIQTERPEIWAGIAGQKEVDRLTGLGDIEGAQRTAEYTDTRVEEIRRLANP